MRFIPLFSGSSGNSSYIEAGGTRLLVDAGMAGRIITDALDEVDVRAETLSGILVTHDHIDHTKGVGVLSRKYDLPVYATAGTFRAMAPIVRELAFPNVRLIRPGEDFYVGSVNVIPFATPHDAAEPCGFCFLEGGKKLCYMTDIGCMRESMFDIAAGSDLLFIESNHDIEMLRHGPYPYPLKQRILSEHGHLSNAKCGEALVRLYETGVRYAVLAHLSRENNTEELAFSTVRSALEDAGIYDMQLVVAKRDRTTAIFEI